MPTLYPAALDDSSSLPTKSAGDAVTTVETNNQSGAIKALEAKLGIAATIGSGTPSQGKTLGSNATGASDWRTALVVDARDYGALPTSGADESGHLQAAINAAAALGGAIVRLQAGTYLVGTVLTISTSGVILEGAGQESTIVKRTGATAGTVVYLQTPDGQLNKVVNVGVRRLSIDGSSTAAYGLRITTVNYADVSQVKVSGCTSVGIFMDCWTTNSGSGEDARDNQQNALRDIRILATGSADGMQVDGNAAHDANTSLNRFDNIYVTVVNGKAFHLGDCDTNTWSDLRAADTGTGTGVQLDSSSTLNIGHARHNVFFNVQLHCTTGMSAQTGTQPSGPNYVFGYNLANSSPLPTGSGVLHWIADDGTFDGQLGFPATQKTSTDPNTLDDYEEGTWTPALQFATVGTSSWAVTTAVGYYTKIGREVIVRLVYQGVPTNGTGAGNLQITGFPFTSSASASPGTSLAVQAQGWTKASYTQATIVLGTSTTTGNLTLSGSGQALATAAVGDIPTGGTVLFRATGVYMT